MTTPLLTLDEIARLYQTLTTDEWTRLLATARAYWRKKERALHAASLYWKEKHRVESVEIENARLRAVVEAAKALSAIYDAASPYELTSEEEALRDALAALRAMETP